MECLSDHNIESLAAKFRERALHPSAALRLLRAYWSDERGFDVDSLSIAKPTRELIRRDFVHLRTRIVHRHVSADSTIKLLIGLEEDDGSGALRLARANPPASVECVLMPSHRADRAAACISSQVGCAMACDFCASTKAGLQRNLGVGEIVEQFMHLRREAAALKRRIASLVFMGMGEPLHNYDNVVAAIRILSEPGLGAMGRRAITVSTVGIVPGIARLADEDVRVQLALSLHAPDDETRSRLVPSNRRWKVADIMQAAKDYQLRTARPVNIEYCMLAGVNDSDQQAELLAERMRGFRAHVNLIPFNTIGGAGVSGVIYRKPSDESIARFTEILRASGVVAHVRQTRGDDVSAACGQLRASSTNLA